MNFGMPYMGSKSKIALSIINMLPNGNRLVDLFGGGGAITHAALYIHKYKKVLYNEFNPLCEKLFEDAIKGKYNENIFTPAFITRKEFQKHKDDDGYIKYICSFGNNGQGYMYSDDNEKIKHIAQDFVVFNKWNDFLGQFIDNKPLTGKSIHDRRIEFIRLIKEKQKKMAQIQLLYQSEKLQQLERFNQLCNIEQLQRGERLQQLEFHCGSYEDYQYQDGDIVYCDPPYGGTTEYSDSFDYDKFLNWVASRPYEVFFSSYSTNYDKRFYKYWQEKKEFFFQCKQQITKKLRLFIQISQDSKKYLYWNK